MEGNRETSKVTYKAAGLIDLDGTIWLKGKGLALREQPLRSYRRSDSLIF